MKRNILVGQIVSEGEHMVTIEETPVPSPTDLAYLAGLLDGEGSICILKGTRAYGTPKHWLEVSIGNTHLGVLQWVQETFGGRVSHNAERFTKRNHRTWRWRASASEAAAILRFLLPYLKIKVEQARLALEFSDHITQYAQDKAFLPLAPDEIAWREKQKLLLSSRNLRHRQRD